MAFGGAPKPPPVQPVAPAPTISQANIDSQKEQQAELQRQQMGRASTIMNSGGGQGLGNMGTVSAAQLLGG